MQQASQGKHVVCFATVQCCLPQHIHITVLNASF